MFCGDGLIKDFIGGYTEYRTFIKDYEAEKKRQAAAARPARQADPAQAPAPARPRRLTYKEQKEMEALEKTIEELTAEKEELEALLNGGTSDYQRIQSASERYRTLKDELDAAELRWLELSEIPS